MIIEFVSLCCGVEIEDIDIFSICTKCNQFCEVEIKKKWEEDNAFKDPNQLKLFEDA